MDLAELPREYSWSRLDNTGKLFPAVSGELTTNVFRISVTLDEPVDPETLTMALYLALADVPAFQVKLRRGLFWYYFEQNFHKPQVFLESEYPCAPIARGENGGFLFSVFHFRRRVSLEVFHVLADGSGAVYFLGRLLTHYLHLRHPGEIPQEALARPLIPQGELEEDGFARYYSTDYPAENTTFDRVPALSVAGTLLPLGAQQVMEAAIPASRLLEEARKWDATLTEYLAAHIFMALATEYPAQAGEKPVKVSIPVNLRRYFPTGTVRNFFMFVRFLVDFRAGEKDFATVLGEIKAQMAGEVNRERFSARIRYHVELERGGPLRLVPRPIKDFGLRIAYHMAEDGYSCTFTNLGRLPLPKACLPFVEGASVLLGASRNNTLKISLASVGEKAVMTFVSSIEEVGVQRRIITALAAAGLPVTLSTNQLPERRWEP